MRRAPMRQSQGADAHASLRAALVPCRAASRPHVAHQLCRLVLDRCNDRRSARAPWQAKTPLERHASPHGDGAGGGGGSGAIHPMTDSRRPTLRGAPNFAVFATARARLWWATDYKLSLLIYSWGDVVCFVLSAQETTV